MLNQRSLDLLATQRFGRNFLRPAYNSYCFAGLPDTLRALFGLPATTPLPTDVLDFSRNHQHVILILIDAFGWQQLLRYLDSSAFLREIMHGGIISQLSSQFPSTTSAHVTCLHTGLNVASSGIYEWYYYEPLLDLVIAPLLFTIAGNAERERLARRGVDPASILPRPTLYLELQAAGVDCTVFQPIEFARSTYSTHVTRGAQTVPYHSLPEALVNVRRQLESSRGRSYTFVYFPTIDTLSHRYGPYAAQVDAEIRALLWLLEDLLRALRGRGDTLLLLTADHGQVPINPATTIYLNRSLPAFSRMVRRNRRGQLIAFGGSARDLFLYVQEAQLETALALLKRSFEGVAEVHRTADLIAAGLFGPDGVSERLLGRLGNLLLLPYAGESIYWFEEGRFEQLFSGHHGGLTPEELLIPLLSYEL